MGERVARKDQERVRRALTKDRELKSASESDKAAIRTKSRMGMRRRRGNMTEEERVARRDQESVRRALTKARELAERKRVRREEVEANDIKERKKRKIDDDIEERKVTKIDEQLGEVDLAMCDIIFLDFDDWSNNCPV